MSNHPEYIDTDESLILGWIYRHYKDKLYRVHRVVRHSETTEELVLYEPLYENKNFPWQRRVRPKAMFCGYEYRQGQQVKRFTYVEG